MMNVSPPLEDWEMDELDSFLLQRMPENVADAEQADEGLLGMSELDGFFTAILSGPESIPPSEWMQAVWGSSEPAWESQEGFEHIFQLMIRHYNSVADSLMQPGFEFEPVFNESEVDGQRFLVVNDWCLGYMRGVSLTAEAWDKGGDEIFDLLQPIMLFTDEPGLQVLDTLDEEQISDLQATIPGVALEIQRFWLSRRQFPSMSDDQRIEMDVTVDADAPCPCGSGKPFRKCCLH